MYSFNEDKNWMDGFVVFIGAYYTWSADGQRYQVVAADCVANEIRARQFGGSYIHWIGSSQDFAKSFVKDK